MTQDKKCELIETSVLLLDDLIEHSIQTKYVYKHLWNDDDIIMWDNRCTMHSVEPFDNSSIKRIMHRVTLVGENKPIPAL